uniref:Ras-related protein Rab-43 n=1 Tax=Globodera pallida TaxID=36090 RepID=A0A183BK99_GLOPA
MAMDDENVHQLMEQFVAKGAVKLGQFTLKSGQLSPIYVDLRAIVSNPKIMNEASRLLCSTVEAVKLDYDYVVGVPYGAATPAAWFAAKLDKPVLFLRKEAKTHGTRLGIDGLFEGGKSVLLIEDVVTSGASVLEAVVALRDAGLRCDHVFCVMDREQGGHEKLQREGITMHSLLRMSSLLNYLERCGTIDASRKAQIVDQLQNPPYAKNEGNLSSSDAAAPSTAVEWAEQFAHGTLNRRLAQIMVTKRTNICLAVDYTRTAHILEVVSVAKEHICALKLHRDIVEDFDAQFVAKLHQLATDHQFLIVEDRKFADTGKTMELQLTGGHLPAADWADLVTAHALSGMPSIAALKPIVTSPSHRLAGLLLIAQLSTEGALTDGAYAAKCAQVGRQCGADLVAGFICQQRCHGGPDIDDKTKTQFLHWTPGVNLSGASGDGLGQRWRAPAEAVGRDACDIVVVGRGITAADDVGAEARRYARVTFQTKSFVTSVGAQPPYRAFKSVKIALLTAPEAHPMDPDDSFDYLFKVVLIGDMGIGKTCVVQRFKNGTYIEKQGTTIGVDFTMKTLMVEGKRIKLQIWDTGGQERFRTITQSYYRSANGIILCYDLTCPESFMSLQRWIDDVSKFAVPNVAKILVGTKADLVEEQGATTASSDRVDTLEAEQLCRAHAMLAHLEVSSKQNVNVDTIFHELAHHLKCQYDELGHLDGTAGGRAAADAFRLGYPNTTNLSARWRRCCNYYA